MHKEKIIRNLVESEVKCTNVSEEKILWKHFYALRFRIDIKETVPFL